MRSYVIFSEFLLTFPCYDLHYGHAKLPSLSKLMEWNARAARGARGAREHRRQSIVRDSLSFAHINLSWQDPTVPSIYQTVCI